MHVNLSLYIDRRITFFRGARCVVWFLPCWVISSLGLYSPFDHGQYDLHLHQPFQRLNQLAPRRPNIEFIGFEFKTQTIELQIQLYKLLLLFIGLFFFKSCQFNLRCWNASGPTE